jgi:hypothetical protein
MAEVGMHEHIRKELVYVEVRRHNEMQPEHVVHAEPSLSQHIMRQKGKYVYDKQMLSDRWYLSEHNCLCFEIMRKSTKKVPNFPIIGAKTRFFR